MFEFHHCFQNSMCDWHFLHKKFEVEVAQASRRHFGPGEEPGQQGLLTLLLSVTRPQAQLILAAIWPKGGTWSTGPPHLALQSAMVLPMPPF